MVPKLLFFGQFAIKKLFCYVQIENKFGAQTTLFGDLAHNYMTWLYLPLILQLLQSMSNVVRVVPLPGWPNHTKGKFSIPSHFVNKYTAQERLINVQG